METADEIRRLINDISGPGLSVREACEKLGVSRTSYTRWKDSLSSTDEAREEKNPGYHTFEDTSFSRECVNCKTSFQTRLSLNKYCSEDCRP